MMNGVQLMMSATPSEKKRVHLQRTMSEEGFGSKAASFFQRTILEYFRCEGRDLPWRRTEDPYHIFISEIMLQQTQVERVGDKYCEFIRQFPSFGSLAEASLQDVLAGWQGLGYNKRALNLKKSAEIIETRFRGRLPSEPKVLQELPGIGQATASSIAAFAFNRPVVFIEINIRCVFLYFFFREHSNVSDRDVLPLVRKTLPVHSPRRWYSALMDYGSMLRKNYPDLIQQSRHYHRQARFAGSDRQIRGRLLRLLLSQGTQSYHQLSTVLGIEDKRLQLILNKLMSEGFIVTNKNMICISQEVQHHGKDA